MSSELGVERPTTLPLPEPQETRRVHFGDVNSAFVNDNGANGSNPFTRDPEFRPKRSRSASFCAPGEYRYGNKRRKKYRVLPSKFLLGGNITDPLNLGSLDREEASQLGLSEASGGASAKKSDAVRVIIPPNINDPLNLDVSSDNEESLNDALLRQLRKRRRNRKRKRRLSEPSGGNYECEPLRSESLEECQSANSEGEANSTVVEVLPKISVEKLKPLSVDTELTTTTGDEQKESTSQPTPGAKPSTSGFQRPSFKKQRSKSDNKIVSPVIPQPGVDRKRHPSHSRQHAEKPHLSQQNLKLPKKFNPKNELFQYGNYNKYYGYRNPDMTPDVRLEFLRPEWFDGKDILDVGCNIGHISLTIARDFNPKSVVGLDIDKKLVNIAQKNIKHYMQKGNTEETNFPKSMRLLYGPLKPQRTADGLRRFPYNVKFLHANYVLESDELLETVRPEFDVIMCLSITKWVHLNWGDSGLKRFFRRIFYNLKPGGRFILEPQGWPSYNKRRKLTMRIFENYKNIRLFPDRFNDYLLHEVGFSTSEKIITPQHTSRGFQRPIIIYTKAEVGAKACHTLDRKSSGSSTKCGNVFKKLDFSSEYGVAESKPEITDKCLSKVKGENDCLNPSFHSSKEDSDHSQKNNHSEGSSCAKTGEATMETLDCVSNSQCSGKNETFEKRPQLANKRDSGDFVCDNTIKSSSDDSGSLLTHSQNHKKNQCVVKPPCTPHTENVHNNKTHSGSSLCAEDEVKNSPKRPASKAGNDVSDDVLHGGKLNSLSPSDKRTFENSKLLCLSATNEENPTETQETACDRSKKNESVGVKDLNREGLVIVTEPRSPEK